MTELETMIDSPLASEATTDPQQPTPPARSAVCTLFEGHYHLGLGALANSLSSAGFNGRIFAGYRGALPEWCRGRCDALEDGTHAVRCGEAELVFVPVQTERHLTNFKPEFMLDVWDRFAAECDRIFYFDPDIVVLADWSYFESWADAGVALVMDGNTPLPMNHPLRVAWRKYFEPLGFKFSARHDYHFNAGFIGVAREMRRALVAWKEIQTAMAAAVPLTHHIGMRGAPEHMRSRLFPFYLTDQDALNIMTELEGIDLSPMGSEGMGWKIPQVYMTHALGSPKPWLDLYLREARRGHAPNYADDVFWNYAQSPLPLFPERQVRKIKRHIRWARVLAPFGLWIQNVRALFSPVT